MRTYIGIDNGASGSVGVIPPDSPAYQFRIPVKKTINYQKKVQNITRVDFEALLTHFKSRRQSGILPNPFVLIERPFTGQNMKTVAAGMRAFEAVLIVIEYLGIPYQIIDSKEWQKELLPSGIKGSPALKKAGIDTANRLFPDLEFKGDADGILIAEYARRKAL